jgi:hypothetical protein
MTVKTQACKLFEAMCDNIDGSTTFAAIFCCNAINKVYGKSITEESLWDMENDPFLANTPVEFVVDACLLAITVISYILPERKDLTAIFTRSMDINIDELLERKPIPASENALIVAKAVILRSRMSLLIGYYGDMLYVNNFEAFKKSTSFLFESIGMSQGAEKVVALQCVDTLKTIVVDSDIAKRFLTFLPEIVLMITKLMESVNFPQFFEFVLEFVKFYCRVLNE